MVGLEIGLGTVQPDGGGIVRVAGEEQAVGAIEERDRVGRMAGRREDLQCAAAQVNVVGVVNV
ncbi:MAG TPA: hypothetical protein VK466_08670 [Terriglobales bacterium]|nr:hypothetical protein [Terriglobales bacterium]